MVLSADNLTVRYRNGAIGIIDVSLQVDAGQIVAIFGPNGAGKTTTVRAISGFLRTEGARVINGNVTLFDEDITNLEPNASSSRGLAFVPERQKIYPTMTVADNLAAVGKLPPRAERRRVYEQIYELFPTLKDRQKELAGRLSGGQQQMLAIARTFFTRARVLVIDEMTLGLHTSVHGPLYEVVKTVARQGTAVLLVDESTSSALAVVDYCYLLSGGKVRMSGAPEIFAGNELLAAGYVES
jgi:branched-chain amino acid transport system ATP-binding protein